MIARSVLIAALLAYAEARFGQEQIPIQAIQQVQGGSPGQAPTIAGAAISDLLAATSACDKVARADQIVSQLGGGADAIAAAKGMLTAEKNTNPFNNGNAQKVCNDPALPATAELRGITPLIDPAANGAADVNDLSKKSATAPLDATGKSIFQLISDAGFGASVAAETQPAKADITAAGGANQNANANANANANQNANKGNANQAAAQASNSTQNAAGNQNANKGNAGKANQNKGNANQAQNANKGNANQAQNQNAACNAAAGANAAAGNAKANKNNGAMAGENQNAAAAKDNKNNGAMAGENQNAAAAKANKGNGAMAGENQNTAAAKDNKNNGAQAAAKANKGNANKGNAAAASAKNGTANAAAACNAQKGQANNGKANNGNAAAANNANKGNANKGNAASATAAAGNAASTSAASSNAASGNNAAAGNAAAGGSAAQKSSIAGLDFGTCVPTIKFEGGQGNRPATEFTFQMIDPVAAKGQQEALNPVIIGNRMCDQLTNVCAANQAAKDACQSALADMKAAGTKDKTTADNWNTALGFAGTVTNPDGGDAQPAAAAGKTARSFRA